MVCSLTFTPKSISSHVRHLHELGVDLLVCFTQYSNEIFRLLHVGWGEEGVGRAGLGRSGCTPNTMNIVLRTRRVIKVDHKLDVIHICTVHGICAQCKAQNHSRLGKKIQQS